MRAEHVAKEMHAKMQYVQGDVTAVLQDEARELGCKSKARAGGSLGWSDVRSMSTCNLLTVSLLLRKMQPSWRNRGCRPFRVCGAKVFLLGATGAFRKASQLAEPLQCRACLLGERDSLAVHPLSHDNLCNNPRGIPVGGDIPE